MADQYTVKICKPDDLPIFTQKKIGNGIGADIKVTLDNNYVVSFVDETMVKFIRGWNLGENWTDPIDVDTGVEKNQTGIMVDKINQIYLFYVKKVESIAKIFYKKSVNKGVTWGSAVEVENFV